MLILASSGALSVRLWGYRRAIRIVCSPATASALENLQSCEILIAEFDLRGAKRQYVSDPLPFAPRKASCAALVDRFRQRNLPGPSPRHFPHPFVAGGIAHRTK